MAFNKDVLLLLSDAFFWFSNVNPLARCKVLDLLGHVSLPAPQTTGRYRQPDQRI